MYFPLFLDLSEKEILVVGAGTIASRRIRALCGFAGRITVVALKIPVEFGSRVSADGVDFRRKSGRERENTDESAEYGIPVGNMEIAGTRITVFEKPFTESDLNQKDLVLAATDDAGLNARIGALCQARGIPVNVCSEAKRCDFQFPSIVEDGAVVIGINASGENHRLVKETRQRIENLFDEAEFRSRYENG
ncbi:MAG: bifunctional precorrin-2 dehydrogenase/sirohydrochlorin ferrochelatase [Lachnospiraceae bacterium]|nr:bifunctional precorrin-2 dehydrogenase/sirohydrochlorin ferrochelatase [Lachnospiraceae bacterium]